MTSASIIGFDSIVIFSFVFGLLVLCTTIFSSKIRRQPTWYGFLTPVFISDIILLLGMGYQTNTGPPEGLCVFQAVLIYSIPGWVVMGFSCFVIAFYFDLKATITTEEDQEYSSPPVSKWASFLLLITPLIFFSGFIALNSLLVALDPVKPSAILNRHKLYCTPRSHTGLYIGGTAMSTGICLWIFIVVKAGILFRRHSLKIREKNEILYRRFLPVYVRAAAISIAGLLCVGLYIWSYATDSADNIFSSYFLSFPSLIIFCVFGSQKDIIQAWAFWRRDSQKSLEDRSFLSMGSSSSVTLPIQSMAAVYFETRTHGNWRRLGYNWNYKAQPR